MEHTLCKPQGQLILANSDAFSVRFKAELLGDKSGKICMDLSGITQCDSAGLAWLIESKKLSKQYNKSLSMINVPDTIKNLARFCGVEEILFHSYNH